MSLGALNFCGFDPAQLQSFNLTYTFGFRHEVYALDRPLLKGDCPVWAVPSDRSGDKERLWRLDVKFDRILMDLQVGYKLSLSLGVTEFPCPLMPSGGIT